MKAFFRAMKKFCNKKIVHSGDEQYCPYCGRLFLQDSCGREDGFCEGRKLSVLWYDNREALKTLFGSEKKSQVSKAVCVLIGEDSEHLGIFSCFWNPETSMAYTDKNGTKLLDIRELNKEGCDRLRFYEIEDNDCNVLFRSENYPLSEKKS